MNADFLWIDCPDPVVLITRALLVALIHVIETHVVHPSVYAERSSKGVVHNKFSNLFATFVEQICIYYYYSMDFLRSSLDNVILDCHDFDEGFRILFILNPPRRSIASMAASPAPLFPIDAPQLPRIVVIRARRMKKRTAKASNPAKEPLRGL